LIEVWKLTARSPIAVARSFSSRSPTGSPFVWPCFSLSLVEKDQRMSRNLSKDSPLLLFPGKRHILYKRKVFLCHGMQHGRSRETSSSLAVQPEGWKQF